MTMTALLLIAAVAHAHLRMGDEESSPKAHGKLVQHEVRLEVLADGTLLDAGPPAQPDNQVKDLRDIEQAHYVALGKNTTFLVSTFGRCSLVRRLVLSPGGIREQFPESPILVMDNGWESEEVALAAEDSKRCVAELSSAGVTYSFAPFDSGLSKVRNMLVAVVETSLLFLMDDDTIFPHDVSQLYEAMVLSPNASMVGTAMAMEQDGKASTTFSLDFCESPDHHHACRFTPDNQQAASGGPCYWSHSSYNFFLARTSVIQKHPWDETLFLAEHSAYFFKLWQDNVGVLVCPNVVFVNDHSWKIDTTFSPAAHEYKKYRERAHDASLAHKFCESTGISRFDGLGDQPLKETECRTICNKESTSLLEGTHNGTQRRSDYCDLTE